MRFLLLSAAALAVLLGLAHSYLGERYVLTRLFRRTPLPKLFGSDWFTRRTLRFAWHLTTVSFWGLAALLVLAASSPTDADFRQGALVTVAVTFLVSAVVAFTATRGRHLSWIVFVAMAALILLANR